MKARTILATALLAVTGYVLFRKKKDKDWKDFD